jgi:DNA-nicking Smr family endonuclease
MPKKSSFTFASQSTAALAPENLHLKTKNISSEELLLWKVIAESTKPIKQRQLTKTFQRKVSLSQRSPKKMLSPPVEENFSALLEEFTQQSRYSPCVQKPVVSHTLLQPPQPEKQKIMPVLGLDAVLKRDLKQGKRNVQAALDLHGLTQEQAYSAVENFIIKSKARGNRLLLVITGKGKTKKDTMILESARDLDNVGILRQKLPLWVQNPTLKPYIQAVEPAYRHHGGEGAFYIFLRK